MATSRIQRIFSEVFRYARRRAPWIPVTKVRFCDLADRDHRKVWRHFAHSLHVPGFVCFAREAEREVTDREAYGLSLHELGHIVAVRLKLPEHMKPARGSGTPKRVQNEANAVVLKLFRIRIKYNRRTLQEAT